MSASITFRALGIHARRILDFLMCQHAGHAGRENGNLGATYRQLEGWGVSGPDVRKGFAELYATGFVILTHQGMRQAGGGEPSRYALSWLPTAAATTAEEPPSHKWTKVIEDLNKRGVGSVAQVRRWMDGETECHRRGQARKQNVTPHLQVVSPNTCKAMRAV